jgi:hypothetical protein
MISRLACTMCKLKEGGYEEFETIFKRFGDIAAF